MKRRFTFSQKLAGAFALVVLLAVTVGMVATYALRQVVATKDHVIEVAAQRLVDTERLHGLSSKKAAASRAYVMTKDPQFLHSLGDTRQRFRAILETLRREVQTEKGRQLLDEIDAAEEAHERALQRILALAGSEGVEALGARMQRDLLPLRSRLDLLIDQFVAREDRLLAEGRAASTESADRAVRLVIGLVSLVAALSIVLSVMLSRALARQISTAVQHVETSSAELQATAGEQATGAKEQATAMAEITTTINELLATSRQIFESAQRVAGIARDTASAASAGDETILRGQDSIGIIRRQVELIVNNMLELGRKSQQIGGILEIINELAEQTNILAVNATIEAAGAGEAGKRFGVVAEEIRKLADRVGASAKDIRLLVEEVRSAVNTTVMATESGSKSVEAGARQFSDVTAAFAQIARLVGTTTDAAREIELSTKQQATAVEQVNAAIADVAQATREAEASAGQALQTASQLAAMSRGLALLVKPSVRA